MNNMSNGNILRAAKMRAAGARLSDISATLGIAPTTISRELAKVDRRGGRCADSDREAAPPDLEIRACPSAIGYGVSADGRVWSIGDDVPRVMSTRLRGQYLRVRLSIDGRLVDMPVCHLVADQFVGVRPPGGIIRYRDGDPLNVSAVNLEWHTGHSFITDRDFVRVWQESFSIAEAADRLGTYAANVMVRAKKLRAAGVPLKDLSIHQSVEELTRLIEEKEITA